MKNFNISFNNVLSIDKASMQRIYNFAKAHLIADCEYESIGSAIPQHLNITQDITLLEDCFKITNTRFEGTFTDKNAIREAVSRYHDITVERLKYYGFTVKSVSVKHIDGKHHVDFKIENANNPNSNIAADQLDTFKDIMEVELAYLLDRFAAPKRTYHFM